MFAYEQNGCKFHHEYTKHVYGKRNLEEKLGRGVGERNLGRGSGERNLGEKSSLINSK